MREVGTVLVALQFVLIAALLAEAAFAAARHPVTPWAWGCAVAAALAGASLVGWGMCAALAVVLGAKATIEERWMLSVHPAYVDYRQRSKRFIPMLW